MGVILCASLAFVLALAFEGNIRSVWKTLGSYSASCLLVPVVYGYIGKIKDKEFVFSCLLGVVAVTFWKLYPLGEFWAVIDELYIGILTTSLGLVIAKRFL